MSQGLAWQAEQPCASCRMLDMRLGRVRVSLPDRHLAGVSPVLTFCLQDKVGALRIYLMLRTLVTGLTQGRCCSRLQGAPGGGGG